MMPSYGYYYGYFNQATIFIIVILVAIILGAVFYFTFLNKKNEGKFTGTKEKIYNFFNFNRFYVEDILKLLYVISAAVVTAVGIVQLFSGISGILVIIIGNVALRISYELIMMFIILCRKTVSVDKKLDKITDFYGDDFDEGEYCCEKDECADCAEDDCADCEEGGCESCCQEGGKDEINASER